MDYQKIEKILKQKCSLQFFDTKTAGILIWIALNNHLICKLMILIEADSPPTKFSPQIFFHFKIIISILDLRI